jgi:hypothetical protein
MPRSANATGRSLTKGNFAQIPEIVMHSPAFTATPLAARALLMEIALLYRGVNNGFIGLSVRQAVSRMKCSKDTAATCFRELQENGLIERTRRGNFDAKTAPLASEWRLTWRPCNRSNQLPSHAYRNWTPKCITKPRKKRAAPVKRTAPSDEGDSNTPKGGLQSDEGDSKPGFGTLSCTVKGTLLESSMGGGRNNRKLAAACAKEATPIGVQVIGK